MTLFAGNRGRYSGTAMADRSPLVFDGAFRARLAELMRWRRDLRRFRPYPVGDAFLERLIGLAALAPSVGNSRPWRFVEVTDATRRAAVRRDFEPCDAAALAAYAGEKARLYASLELAGRDRAPVQLAVFADFETSDGHGQATMPETPRCSVVGAITALWRAAGAHGVGVGRVSVLDSARLSAILEVPASWSLVTTLGLGHPEEEHAELELKRHGWQEGLDVGAFVVEP